MYLLSLFSLIGILAELSFSISHDLFNYFYDVTDSLLWICKTRLISGGIAVNIASCLVNLTQLSLTIFLGVASFVNPSVSKRWSTISES